MCCSIRSTHPTKNQSIEINNATLEEALDYVSVITKSFWKPLSSNTIFATNDNTTKRRDYEEQVMKVFYLSNVNTPQELQEIADRGALGGGHSKTLCLQRPERDHRAGRGGPHCAGRKDYPGSGQT